MFRHGLHLETPRRDVGRRAVRERRSYVLATAALALLICVAQLGGCRPLGSARRPPAASNGGLTKYTQLAIEAPATDGPTADDLGIDVPPITLRTLEEGAIEYWDLSLEEAIGIGLSRSRVFRNLGGVVLDAPAAARTVFDPAVTETDPRFGVEGALSAFDAQWSTGVFVEKNDRALNNQFFGGGARLLQQDLAEYRSELSKRTATGSLLTVRNIAEYDFNNAPANLFENGAWTVKLEAEARTPLLQGAGVDFNRIAGPNGSPGLNQGVLIARVNADVALADFEAAVRDLVLDIETAYWELYYGYRDLDAKTVSRDRALATWQRIRSLSDTGQRGGEASREAQARAQFYRQQEEVQNAFAGQALERSRATTFRGTGGVLANERRLRLLLDLPIVDGRLIRPADEPIVAPVSFAWGECVDEALVRRVELRRQRWEIQRSELELIAAKNYLLPRLDAVGRYRWRGFGHDLLATQGPNPRFDNALEDLVTGDFQEWQMGVEYRFPVGFRQAHAGYRQAQLNLARDRALLEAQERDVVADLTNAVSELDRAFVTLESNLERLEATLLQLEALQAVYDDDITDENQRLRLLDLILDAQRNVAEAESRCHRGQVEYQLAIRQVHFAKGSLLEYDSVALSEGPWSQAAIRDAARRGAQRRRMSVLNDYLMPARRLSDGPVADAWQGPIEPTRATSSGDAIDSPDDLSDGARREE